VPSTAPGERSRAESDLGPRSGPNFDVCTDNSQCPRCHKVLIPYGQRLKLALFVFRVSTVCFVCASVAGAIYHTPIILCTTSYSKEPGKLTRGRRKHRVSFADRRARPSSHSSDSSQDDNSSSTTPSSYFSQQRRGGSHTSDDGTDSYDHDSEGSSYYESDGTSDDDQLYFYVDNDGDWPPPLNESWQWRSSSVNTESKRTNANGSVTLESVDGDGPRQSTQKLSVHDIHHADWAREIVYDVDSDKDHGEGPDNTAPEWTLPRTKLDESTSTELLVDQSIEFRTLRSGREQLVLICPSEPPSSTSDAPDKPQPAVR
jgi:hypothetical protein